MKLTSIYRPYIYGTSLLAIRSMVGRVKTIIFIQHCFYPSNRSSMCYCSIDIFLGGIVDPEKSYWGRTYMYENLSLGRSNLMEFRSARVNI